MRKMLAVALAVALSALAGCGDDGGSEAQGDPERYCELTKKLDDRFEELGNVEAKTPDDIKKAISDLVKETDGDFQALIDAAPADVKPELDQARGILKKVGDGDLEALQELEALDDSKSTAYEKEHCKA